MKSFLHRLKFYGLGFGLGLVFVFFFFRNRGCTWTPENRVKNTILGRVLVISDEQQEVLKANGITQNTAVMFLNDGDIAFGESQKDGNPQVYSILHEVNGKEVELWFTLPKNSYISEIQWPTGSIKKAGNTKKGNGKMVHFPNVDNIVYLDTNRRLTCQLDYTGLISSMSVMKRLKKNGEIDFGRSELKRSGLPVHYIRFTDPKHHIVEAKTTWYQEHIQFSGFLMQDSIICN